MRRKLTDGLYLRKDGRYQRKEQIGGVWRTFSSQSPAEVWVKIDAAKAEQCAKDHAAAAAAQAGPLFAEVADEYQTIVLDMKPGTQKSYLPAIHRAVDAFGDCRMKEIEPYMIAQFLRGPEMAGRAATTVSNQKTIINNIYQHWINSPKWRGDCNPARQTEIPRGLPKRKRQPPTDAEVQLVKEHYLDPDALLPVAYICTGERRGEMCAIQLRDIDFKQNIIHIRKTVEHQGNTPVLRDYAKTPAGIRQVPLLSMLREALQPVRKLPKDTYIIGLNTKPVSKSRYDRMWQKFWRKYGVAQPIPRTKQVMRDGRIQTVAYTDWKVPVCGHQFRHEYVCMLALADVPEEIAIQLVGHANAKMIHEVYLSLKPKMIEDARMKLESVLHDAE
ncbi:tyrosine-type recombinase/integrase [uncultured Gemmiger sp.]|uniref:tyrosine-type recombinase/integrase n=1 Tax=uncultured Gemmiger sp. TaxID=1623490 RepID=UPI00266D9B99|nr:tyrosine-type recombinase/integrase [uncultured Gemmiger sp.]